MEFLAPIAERPCRPSFTCLKRSSNRVGIPEYSLCSLEKRPDLEQLEDTLMIK